MYPKPDYKPYNIVLTYRTYALHKSYFEEILQDECTPINVLNYYINEHKEEIKHFLYTSITNYISWKDYYSGYLSFYLENFSGKDKRINL